MMEACRSVRTPCLSRIVQMVAAAQRSRAPIQKLADQVSGWFVPLVIVIAIAAFIAWSIWGPEPVWPMEWWRRRIGADHCLSVCTGLATPMSIMVWGRQRRPTWLLIKNAEALERLEKIDTIVVDKTGTLTEGRPKVTHILPAQGFDEGTLLAMAASLERASEHPLAVAIVAAADERKLVLSEPLDVDSPVGKGLTGIVSGRKVLIGSAKYLEAEGIARATGSSVPTRYAGRSRRSFWLLPTAGSPRLGHCRPNP